MISYDRFNLPNKLKTIESSIQLEMKKGPNKNRDLLIELGSQKKALKVAMGTLSSETIIPREALLVKCDALITQLENAYMDALTEGTGSEASIDSIL